MTFLRMLSRTIWSKMSNANAKRSGQIVDATSICQKSTRQNPTRQNPTRQFQELNLTF